jgi:hypothetical protein
VAAFVAEAEDRVAAALEAALCPRTVATVHALAARQRADAEPASLHP